MTEDKLVSGNLKTPKAAAVAGMLFCGLLLAAYAILRTALPADPNEPGAWLRTRSQLVMIGINLIPFAGVAFLWFVGVLRDRLGTREDRFLATVVLGSGLLFLAMLFSGAAVIGAIIIAFSAAPHDLANSDAFHVARAIAYNLANVYMTKMAAVFTISLSTIAIFTTIFVRWISFSGYVVAALLLFGSDYFDWVFIAFPLWILLISLYILKEKFIQKQ